MKKIIAMLVVFFLMVFGTNAMGKSLQLQKADFWSSGLIQSTDFQGLIESIEKTLHKMGYSAETWINPTGTYVDISGESASG